MKRKPLEEERKAIKEQLDQQAESKLADERDRAMKMDGLNDDWLDYDDDWRDRWRKDYLDDSLDFDEDTSDPEDDYGDYADLDLDWDFL